MPDADAYFLEEVFYLFSAVREHIADRVDGAFVLMEQSFELFVFLFHNDACVLVYFELSILLDNHR